MKEWNKVLKLVGIRKAHAAKEGTAIGAFRYVFVDGAAIVTGRASSRKVYEVPAKVVSGGREYVVRKIGRKAFLGSSARRLVLPDTVESIGSEAFYASAMEEVVLSGTLKKIGYMAFANMEHLQTVILPPTLTDMGDYVFNNCPQLHTLVYLSTQPPSNWAAVGQTYVPDPEAYRQTASSADDAQIKGLLTFASHDFTYTGRAPKVQFVCNVPDFRVDLSATPTLNAEVGAYTSELAMRITDIDNRSYDIHLPYAYHVRPARLVVSVADAERAYGEANPAFELTYAGFIDGEDAGVLAAPVQVSTDATPASPVGSYTIALFGGAARNYALAYTPGRLKVAPAPLQARVADVERPYGAPNPAFHICYIGLKNEETEPEWLGEPVCATPATAATAVGRYPIEARGGRPRNYALTAIEPGILTVHPAPLRVTVADAERLYGEANPDFALHYDGFANGEDERVLTQPVVATADAGPATSVGSYPITLAGGAACNYVLTLVAGTLTVKKHPLRVSTPDYRRTYGEANPTVELQYEGFALGETPADLTRCPAPQNLPTKAADAGTYAIELGGGEATNYDFVYQGGTLTIEKADQTLEWDQDLTHLAAGDQMELTARASSGLKVTYLVQANTFLDIYSTGHHAYLDCLAAGETFIRATQEGDRNYNAAERLSKRVVVKSSRA